MKITYLNIILSVLALVIYSCAGESSYQNDNTVIEATKTEGEVKEETFRALEDSKVNFTDEQLKAFETRAIQKFYDFTDYVKILSDPNIAIDLKKQAKLSAMELFKIDSLNMDSSQMPHFNSVSISSYLGLIELSDKSVHIIPKNVVVSKGLKLDATEVIYSGVIESTLIMNGKKEKYKIDIHLIEIEKKFGDASQ